MIHYIRVEILEEIAAKNNFVVTPFKHLVIQIIQQLRRRCIKIDSFGMLDSSGKFAGYYMRKYLRAG